MDLNKHGPRPFHKTWWPSSFRVLLRTDIDVGYFRFSGESAWILDFIRNQWTAQFLVSWSKRWFLCLSVSDGNAAVQLTIPVKPPASSRAAELFIFVEKQSAKYELTAKKIPYVGTFRISVQVIPWIFQIRDVHKNTWNVWNSEYLLGTILEHLWTNKVSLSYWNWSNLEICLYAQHLSWLENIAFLKLWEHVRVQHRLYGNGYIRKCQKNFQKF